MDVVLFFFSSRRRHTRYIGDWSSDVCSSDLLGLGRKGEDADGPVVVDETVFLLSEPEVADRKEIGKSVV